MDEIHRNAVSKGFWDKDPNLGEKLMLVVTELAEALEVHRRKGGVIMLPSEGTKLSIERLPDETFSETFAIQIKDTFPDEMADALIRILDLCGKLNIDIAWHVKYKMKYNATRARLHGKAY
jgi:NTP pyrophosphatase (non-canonical NTP hydrolase)